MAKNTVRRQVKFDYYRLASRKLGDKPSEKDRLFDFKLWADKVKNLSLPLLAKEYYQEQARMEGIVYSEADGYWFTHYSRLKNTMIPSRATTTTNVEPLELEDDEYLGEVVTALYDEKTHIFMLQRNRNSLTPSALEAYLNAVWDNTKQHIYLRPILAIDTANRVKKSSTYRRLSIRFADIDKTPVTNNNLKRAKQFVESFREYGPVNAEITLTMGKSRNTSLSGDTVSEIIDELIENREGSGVVKAEIGLKESDDSAVEIVDLFEEKAQSAVFFEVPIGKSLEHKDIRPEMARLYNESKKRLIGYLTK